MDEPFQTSDRKLAFALCVAGVRFSRATEEDPNRDGPAFNDYTPGFLKQERFAKRLAGKTFDEAARILIEAKIHGTVTYCFERGPDLDRARKTYQACSDAFYKAQKMGTQPELPEVSIEAVVQVLFVAQHKTTTEAFDKIPFIRRRDQRVNTMVGEMKTEKLADGSGSRTTGKAKGYFHTVGAGREIKEKLKI